jgi:hypothetical protein
MSNNMSEEVQRRICKVEADISEMKCDIGIIKGDVRHIVETLRGLSCKTHAEKIFCLEKKHDRFVVIWATATGGVALIVMLVGLFVHIKGLI